jgi:catechol 2,3-dioxygenase-like lactoylglutathione lyase family enzyme
MDVRRIVPCLESDDFESVKDFYTGVLGLEVGMDYPEFIDFGSPANPTAQIVVTAPGVEQPLPHFGIDVGNPASVDATHAEAVARGLEIVYPSRTSRGASGDSSSAIRRARSSASSPTSSQSVSPPGSTP